MKPITPINNNGSILLRWTIKGQPYSLSGLGPWDSLKDQKRARMLGHQIRRDILEDEFDLTLERYRVGLGNVIKVCGPIDVMFDKFLDDLYPGPKQNGKQISAVTKLVDEHANKRCHDTSWWEHVSHRWNPSTQNKYLAILRRFGKWLVSEEYLKKNPWNDVQMANSSKVKIEPFTREEIQRILEYWKERDYFVWLYLLFSFSTGCRPGEIAALRYFDISPDRKQITVERSMRKYKNLAVSSNWLYEEKSTKTGDKRIIPLSLRLQRGIEGWLHTMSYWVVDNPLIFARNGITPFDYDSFRQNGWKRCLIDLGIPYRKPYVTRHTAASLLLNDGVPAIKVAQMLGHTSTKYVDSTYGRAMGEIVLPNLECESDSTN